MMDSNDHDVDIPAARSWSYVFIITPIITFIIAVATLIALVTFTPRRAENGRSVPNIDWETYAIIGNFAPLLLSMIAITFLFRSTRQRILSWLLAAFFCYVLHEVFVTDLLRRDFIGKF